MEPKQGILQSGQLVAVKKLVRTSGVHDRRFQNEAGNLQILEHRNIVRLLGSCYQVEKKLVERNDRHFLSNVPKKFLCYEYLSNGSLDKYIYGMVIPGCIIVSLFLFFDCLNTES